MITPRRTELVRVRDLHAFRHAITELCRPDPALQVPVVVVPTRGAARQLQGTLAAAGARATIVTRDELYDHLHARLASPPHRLGPLERDVIAQAAARAAAAAGGELSFQLRPGLVAEMLRFYDHLRRQSQQVNRFEALIIESLGSDDVDRATARMRTQTGFLAAAFREYQRRVRDSGGCDEHTLRERLLAEAAGDPVRRVVVTVPDWIADADGLYSADFDLLTRIPGLETLHIVSTERVLSSGFHERLRDWWPGLDERAAAPPRANGGGTATLITPPGAPPEEPWWTLRDREEELVMLARRVKADRRTGDGVPLDRTAIVFKHPLPYLYLAAEVFGAAGIPYRTSDALPLAAEPTAAALDLVLDAVASNFTRATIVALLRSPHFAFFHDEVEVTREAVSALDRALSKARYLGDVERLETVAASIGGIAAPALLAALAAARDLAPLAAAQPASAQMARLLAFWTSRSRPIGDDDPFASRERRARAAVVEMLASLGTVHAAHDDVVWAIDEIGIAVRRWIGEQTFAIDDDPPAGGLHLLDDQAVRFGTSTTLRSWALSSPTGRNGRAAIFSIRRRCSSHSAGRRRKIAAARRTHGFSIC